MDVTNALQRWKARKEDRVSIRNCQRLVHEAQRPRGPSPEIRRAVTPLNFRLDTDQCYERLAISAECAFISKLSFDIRLLTYQEVIGNRCFHIIRKFSKLGHLVCQAENASHIRSGCWGRQKRDGTFDGRSTTGLAPLDDFSWSREDEPIAFRTDGDIMELLLTCKFIYSEAMNILYTSNLFAFREPWPFTLFCSIVPPHRLAQLRHIHLELMYTEYLISQSWGFPIQPFNTAREWVEFWQFVEQRLPGLKTLEVKVMQPPPFWHLDRSCGQIPKKDIMEENNKILCAPLQNLRYIDRVEVILPLECQPSQEPSGHIRLRCLEFLPSADASFGEQ